MTTRKHSDANHRAREPYRAAAGGLLVLAVLVPLLALPQAVEGTAQASSNFQGSAQIEETFDEAHQEFVSPSLTGYYSHSQAGSGLVSTASATQASSGTLSWRLNNPNAASRAVLDFGAYMTGTSSMCNNGGHSGFKVRFETTTEAHRIGWFFDANGAQEGLAEGTFAGAGLFLEFRTTGAVYLHSAAATGGTDTYQFLMNYAADTWYDFDTYGFSCNGAISVIEKTTLTLATASSGGSHNVNSNFIRHFIVAKITSAADADTTVWIDDLSWPGTLSNVGSVGSTATVAVTNLVGFDVDPTGGTAIARTDGGANVRTWSAGTLSGAQVDPTNCNRVRGVAAYSTHVSYFQCDSGTPSDVVSLSIRSASLGTPDKPPVCSGAGFCIENIDDEELEGAQDDQIDLVTVEEFPFDYSEVENDVGDDDAVYMAWGVTSTDGRAGVLSYTMNNNGDDKSDLDTILVDPGASVPDQMCLVQDADGQTYFYAASDASNVKGAKVDFNKNQEGILLTDTLEVTVTEVFAGSSSTSAPAGVGCGEGMFAILNSAKLTLWERGATTPYFTKTGLTSVPSRGVHVSADGLWTAYVSGGSWHVIANTDDFVDVGTEVAANTMPTGTFQELRLQGAGSSMWIAMSTQVVLYGGLFTLTTGEDTVFNPDAPPVVDEPDEPAPTGVGALGTSGCGLDMLFGDSDVARALGCGFLFTVVPFLFIGFQVGGPMGAGIGAGVAGIMLLINGGIPDEIGLLIVVVALLILGAKWKFGGR